MIVDTHTHLLAAGHWPAAWWDHVADDWAAAAPERQPAQIRDKIEPGLLDEDGSRMVERMDRAGVDVSVILPIDWGPELQTTASVTRANDHAAQMAAAHRGRLASFMGIDPRRDGALELIAARQRAGTLHGLKLYPGCGWHPQIPEAYAVYEIAQEAGIPILFHTGDPLPILDRELSDPIHLGAVAQAFPALKMWLGHAGAPDRWEEACRVADASPNVKLEMSVWLWDDSDEAARQRWLNLMSEARDRFGAERLLFGSDHVSGSKVRGDGFLTTVVSHYRSLARTRHGQPSFSQPEVDLILGGSALADLTVFRAPVQSLGDDE